ncbi:MAG TPA: signal peptide peptidase SppA, partial [bacterium]|nr:signal peptide peptidase SppA [bacterium]
DVAKYGTVAPVSRDWGTPPRIGVVYAAGAIAQGPSRTTPLTGETVLGSDTIAAAVKAAAEDPGIRAIVLRVDSPGGDGFASDEIWHEVERAKKKKPVVVSMANVAASGGYFISQGANYIFADPGTITGSIGVFLLKPNFKGTYAKIDYHTYLLSRGAFSELFTAARPWTPEEKEEAGRLIDVFYRDFIAKAAAGRKTTSDAIDAVGRGHGWMGTKAKELKLVDELGGLTDAVEKAKQLAHIPKGRQVAWEAFPREKGLKESLGASEGLPDDLRAELSAMAGGADLGTLELLSTMGNGPVSWSPAAAAWMPRATPGAPTVREEPTRNWLWPIPTRD